MDKIRLKKYHRMKSSERVLRETKEEIPSNFIEDGKFSKACRRKERNRQCFSNYKLHVIE